MPQLQQLPRPGCLGLFLPRYVAQSRVTKPAIAIPGLRRYFTRMTAIAAELDQKLKSLDPKSASSLERLVRDALALLDANNGASRPDRLPPDFFATVAREFGNEPFERPAQGQSEERSAW